MNTTARRRGESHWAWRSRLIGQAQAERDRNESLVTREAERHCIYEDDFVMHVETGTLSRTKRRRHTSSIEGLRDRNQITQDQYTAAVQIARVAESIRRSVGVRCASMEARVDCAGSAHDPLLERLNQVRLERAFSRWRVGIRVPRQLIVDMIVNDRALKETARGYNVGWPRALRMLASALDLWNKLAADAYRDIDERDLEIAHARLQKAA